MHEIEQMKLLGAHPNVVSLVGCCTLQEHKFLVIEYVPFGDLLQWLRRRRRSVKSIPKVKQLNVASRVWWHNESYVMTFSKGDAIILKIAHVSNLKLIPKNRNLLFNLLPAVGLSCPDDFTVLK